MDVHYPTIRPSLEAGKNVFVEWPLASNLKDAQALQDLAKQKGSKTMIGLQGRCSPVCKKLQSLLDQGRIGKVKASSIYAIGGTRFRDNIMAGIKYFARREVGGNVSFDSPFTVSSLIE